MFHNACQCLELLGEHDQAEVWRRKLLAVVKEKTGPESTAYSRELTRLGSNLLQQKKYADAEAILHESLAVLQKKEPEVWETFRTQALLGAALLGRQMYAEAEPHLVHGYQGMKRMEKSQKTSPYRPSPRQLLIEALERVVQLYVGWDKLDQAAKWQKELEALKIDH